MLRQMTADYQRLGARDGELHRIFAEINDAHFDGFLTVPVLRWNSRLRSSAGRFIPGHRRGLFANAQPTIEVASYLLEETNGPELIYDTIGHEMIHYWLWIRRRPYGHTPEFTAKMQMMGVSRYNPVPRLRPYKYLYRCSGCKKEFKTRRKLGPLACSDCCKVHSGGRYDKRFALYLDSSLVSNDEMK